MSTGYVSTVAAPKPDPIFHHVRAGMSVIIKNTDGTWRIADVIHVIGSTKSSKIPLFLQVNYVENHVTQWVKADLVTHIVQGSVPLLQLPGIGSVRMDYRETVKKLVRGNDGETTLQEVSEKKFKDQLPTFSREIGRQGYTGDI